MPHWLIKSGIQRMISWLPAHAFWYELFQTHVTRSTLLSETGFETRLNDAARFYDRFRQHQPNAPESFTAFEVGTGWYPTFPIALYLCGASDIWTFDITGYLRPGRVALVLDFFCAAHDSGKLKQMLPAARPERIERLRALRQEALRETPEQCLKRINIHVRVCDACENALPTGSVDFIFSCGVLEYIPPPILAKLLEEFRRVSSPHSAMVHWLDLADQSAFFDSNVTLFNFLRYTESQWVRRCSPLTPNNRMRINDFREAFARAGFTIKAEENREGKLDQLKNLALAPEFQKYSEADLLVLYSLVTAIPAPDQRGK